MFRRASSLLQFSTKISLALPRARAYCPRKGAHSIREMSCKPSEKQVYLLFRGAADIVVKRQLRSHFLSGDFSARASTTKSSSNDVLRNTPAEVSVGQVSCTHPLCKAGVRNKMPFYGPVAASGFTHHLRKQKKRGRKLSLDGRARARKGCCPAQPGQEITSPFTTQCPLNNHSSGRSGPAVRRFAPFTATAPNRART